MLLIAVPEDVVATVFCCLLHIQLKCLLLLFCEAKYFAHSTKRLGNVPPATHFHTEGVHFPAFGLTVDLQLTVFCVLLAVPVGHVVFAWTREFDPHHTLDGRHLTEILLHRWSL